MDNDPKTTLDKNETPGKEGTSEGRIEFGEPAGKDQPATSSGYGPGGVKAPTDAKTAQSSVHLPDPDEDEPNR